MISLCLLSSDGFAAKDGIVVFGGDVTFFGGDDIGGAAVILIFVRVSFGESVRKSFMSSWTNITGFVGLVVVPKSDVDEHLLRCFIIMLC